MKTIRIFFSIFILFLLLGCKTKPKTSEYHLVPLSSLPELPTLIIDNNPQMISSKNLEKHISEYAKIEWLAEDSTYFLPTKENMDTVIYYLDEVFRKFNITYIPEGIDCDDFARTKTALSKLIISHAYRIEASPAIFTIFVFQKNRWAGVSSGGGHALIVYACTDQFGNPKVFIWEPQGSQQVSVLDYPNKEQLFYIGGERVENPEDITNP